MVLVAQIISSMGCLENTFIYFPAKYPEGYWQIKNYPAIEDCYFKAQDGVELHGWFAGNSNSQTTLLWFHGNAGNITHRLDNLLGLVQLRINVFIIDYRGYGRSEGCPSEMGLYCDAQAAYDYLVHTRQIPSRCIYLFGRSLGGAVAINLALNNDCAGAIVESSFTSLPDIGQNLYPFLSTKLITKITRERYDSLAKISRIKIPLLFIHGDADELIPIEHSRRLFEAANEPKEFYKVHGAAHNDLYLMGGKAYLNKIKAFVMQ
jgi:fermentation-respiration switch protein FrsA (DUF1100 family)